MQRTLIRSPLADLQHVCFLHRKYAAVQFIDLRPEVHSWVCSMLTLQREGAHPQAHTRSALFYEVSMFQSRE